MYHYKRLNNPLSQGCNSKFPSSRGSNSDRGDPEIVSYKDGLPRTLCVLAMTEQEGCCLVMTKWRNVCNNSDKKCIPLSFLYYILYSLLLSLFIYNLTSAASINYQDCYMPWEFGDAEKNYIIVRPLGNKCHKICQNQCKEFSQSSKIGLTGTELNQDIIDKCLLSCQHGGSGVGTTFTSQYRIEDNNPDNISGWKWSPKAFTTNTSCTIGESDPESADFAYYPTDFTVKKGDIVYIDLAGSDSGYGNTIFLCGFETKRITPYKFHPNTTFNNDGNANWDARGRWYDTGVKIKPGDYVEVVYGGKFLGNYQNGRYIPGRKDLNLAFKGNYSSQDYSRRKNYFRGEDLSTCFYKSKEKKTFCNDGNNKTIDCEDNKCDEIMASIGSEKTFCYLRARRSSIVRESLWINGKSEADYPLDQFQFKGYILGCSIYDHDLQIILNFRNNETNRRYYK